MSQERESRPGAGAATKSLDIKSLHPEAEFSPSELGTYTAGFCDGWDAHAYRVQNWLGLAKQTLALPTQDELRRARTRTDEPCAEVRSGLRLSKDCRCSTCTRAIAAWWNRQLYGSPDFPGSDRAAEILAERTAS
jgi:hypothetical protein